MRTVAERFGKKVRRERDGGFGKNKKRRDRHDQCTKKRTSRETQVSEVCSRWRFVQSIDRPSYFHRDSDADQKTLTGAEATPSITKKRGRPSKRE